MIRRVGSICVILVLLGLPIHGEAATQPEPDAQANLPQQLAYEVARARERLSIYVPRGQTLVLIDEEIRSLKGSQGSEIVIYCGRTQSRLQGRVSIGSFYYVLDVVPSGNLLSDYERGAWSIMAENSTDPEYAKLCEGPSQRLDDIQMLRSSTHTSSGSTFRPFINDSGFADNHWLVGRWIGACAGSDDGGEAFEADGSYEGYHGGGTWVFRGNTVTLEISESIELGPAEEELVRYHYPALTKALRIERLGIDRLRITPLDAQSYELTRC